MLFFNRLTATSFVPFNLLTAFSTRAEQAEQVMPVTAKCFFCKKITSFLRIFITYIIYHSIFKGNENEMFYQLNIQIFA